MFHKTHVILRALSFHGDKNCKNYVTVVITYRKCIATFENGLQHSNHIISRLHKKRLT